MHIKSTHLGNIFQLRLLYSIRSNYLFALVQMYNLDMYCKSTLCCQVALFHKCLGALQARLIGLVSRNLHRAFGLEYQQNISVKIYPSFDLFVH